MHETKEYLIKLIGKGEIATLRGKCHDCGCDVSIDIDISPDGDIHATAPFWHKEDIGDFAKCLDCFDKEPMLTNYQPCEVFSRVCGYLRPVKQYNPGKKEEFYQRVNYKTAEDV